MSETLFKTEYRETGERLPADFADVAVDARVARERAIARVRLLWDHRRFLARVTGVGLLASIVVALAIPVRYTSTTRLMPPDSQSGQGLAMLAAASGKVPAGLSSMANDLLGVKSTGDLFLGVLSSRTVRDALIAKFDLRHVYWDSKWEDARKDLAKRTDLGVETKSGIITIEVTDHEPARAAAMAQEYVIQLNRVVIELNTSSAHRERLFLEERLKSVKQDLEDAEKQFSEFASKNTAIDIKEQGRAMVEAAATLQGQLIAAQSELEGLRQIYTDNNVRVRTVEARAAELKHQLEKLGGKDLGDTAGAADAKNDSLYPSIRKLPLLGVEFADLFRRTKVQEAIFETLTQEYELARVQEAKETPTVKVLDPPDVPEKKSFPPRTILTLLGTALAFSFGAAWIFSSKAWEATDPEDVRKVFVLEMFESVRDDLHRLPFFRNGASGGERQAPNENVAPGAPEKDRN